MNRVRKMIGYDSMQTLGYTGKGIYIAVLDSGVAFHPDLDGRIIAFRDFTNNNRKKTTDLYFDDNGHGTHV